jgi:C-terminal processing protease CtpA/Prc
MPIALSHFVRGFLLCVALMTLTTACEPVPLKELTPAQKEADMHWLFSQFDENYAPLEYKVERYGINYKRLKSDYMKIALATPSNGAFYLVMQSFVAQFKDAHTFANLSTGGLPNRASIGYLGFSGKRKGDHFVVTEVLPTYRSKKSNFPVQVGDEISRLDGQSLGEVVRSELVPLEDVGQDESNLTLHMNRLFNRVSLSNIFPAEADAKITIVKRAYSSALREETQEKEQRYISSAEKQSVQLEVSVPWNLKDVYEFSLEQTAARAEQNAGSKIDLAQQVQEERGVSSGASTGLGLLSLVGFDGIPTDPMKEFSRYVQEDVLTSTHRFLNSFYIPDHIESWTAASEEPEEKEASQGKSLQLLKRNRKIPSGAHFVTGPNAIFPTYVTSEVLHDRNGHATNQSRLIATLYLNTFSPHVREAQVLKEFKETLQTLETLKVSHLVIDLMNNGGGSLSLGMALAQALSNEKVEMPGIQFILSESWLRDFEQLSLHSSSDSEKTIAMRIYSQMREELEAGRRLSTPMSSESLIPFKLTPNADLQKKFKIMLVVNEMCASMCDIFTAILKDNEMAQIFGTQTMGAGGNVVTHYSAPNSHLVLRQTESLILRTGKHDGEYIENNGVEPDYPFEVSLYSDQKYKPVLDAAIQKMTASNQKRPADQSLGYGSVGKKKRRRR